MRTSIPLGLFLAAGLALFPRPVRAGEPATTGRVLVLQNERTLAGDIRREGAQYCIKRASGETWVPVNRALLLCATHEEAYQFLRQRANLHDPDERLRLARWCQQNNLRERALEEAAAAVHLRPNHAESRRLLNYLQRPPDPARQEPPAAPDPTEEETPPPPPVEVGTQSFSLFVTKVQPILMNACASCHATGRGGAFKLTRLLGDGRASQRTTQQNLGAVVAQVNLAQPEASPLLIKAVTVHGDAGQPPLKGRQVAAFHTLQDWVRQTVARNPHLREQTGQAAADLPAAEEKPEPAQRSTGWAVEARAKPKAPQAGTAPTPGDPFDPAVFNRQMHSPVAAPNDPRP